MLSELCCLKQSYVVAVPLQSLYDRLQWGQHTVPTPFLTAADVVEYYWQLQVAAVSAADGDTAGMPLYELF